MEYIELGLMAVAIFGVFVMVIGYAGGSLLEMNQERCTTIAFIGFGIAILGGGGSILVSTIVIIINFFS
jgi:hypothetical protein